MVGEHDGRVGMGMQRPEAAAELLVLLDAHFLVAEEDHQIFHQRIVHLLELLVAQGLAEVDAEDLRADGGGELADFDRLVGHLFPPDCGQQSTPCRAAGPPKVDKVRIAD